jgi:hypothetical protein
MVSRRLPICTMVRPSAKIKAVHDTQVILWCAAVANHALFPDTLDHEQWRKAVCSSRRAPMAEDACSGLAPPAAPNLAPGRDERRYGERSRRDQGERYSVFC